jgi:hypothetical protein
LSELLSCLMLLLPSAQVSLMLALSEVSSRTLAAAAQQGFQPVPVGAAAGGLAAVGASGGAAAGSSSTGGGFRLSALNRMVEVLLYNLPRIQVRVGADNLPQTHVMYCICGCASRGSSRVSCY